MSIPLRLCQLPSVMMRRMQWSLSFMNPILRNDTHILPSFVIHKKGCVIKRELALVYVILKFSRKNDCVGLFWFSFNNSLPNYSISGEIGLGLRITEFKDVFVLVHLILLDKATMVSGWLLSPENTILKLKKQSDVGLKFWSAVNIVY